MVAFFKILDEETPDADGPLAYLSTHPRTGDRITRLQARADGAAYRPVPLLPGRSWDDVKRLCR
jgi:predicted Zn-dependent protease